MRPTEIMGNVGISPNKSAKTTHRTESSSLFVAVVSKLKSINNTA